MRFATDSLVDISVYLGAILSMGLDKTDDKDFEDCFKKLIDILSEVSSSYKENSKSFWTMFMDFDCPYSADMLAALIILLPKIVHHFEYPSEQFDDLTVFFRKFLKDVSENCNSPTRASIIDNLKQGFTEKLLKLIKKIAKNNRYPQSFEGLFDCVLFLLKIDANPEEYLSILPDLCFLLSNKNPALTTGEGVAEKVVSVINVLIETSMNDSNELNFALYDESLDYLLQGISVNEEICHHLTSMIIDLIKALRSSICNDDCDSKHLLNSRLQELATKIEPLIDIRNKKTCLRYSQLYCFAISSRLPENRKTESFSTWLTSGDVMTFFTLLKITMSMLNSDGNDLNPHEDPLLKQLINYPFLSATQLEEESLNSMSSLTEIVTNNLPELASQFLEPYSAEYLLFVTKILIKIMDKVDDFYETRWEQLRSLMKSLYFSGFDDNAHAIRATRLVFMWKLFQMDLNSAFVSSLIMYDCKDDEAGGISLTGIDAPFPREIMCEVQGKFFAKIFRDLKQLLLEYHGLDSFEDSKTCLEEITYVLAEMGQRCLEEHHRAMLKELVHVALDISEVPSECNRVISENINSFIRNIYLA